MCLLLLIGTAMSKINCQLSIFIDAFVSIHLVGSLHLHMCHLLFFSIQGGQ